MQHKKGGIDMSFNMIFSLILIAVFLVVAFIAIRAFLDIGNTAEIGQFYQNLQEAIDQSWEGQAGSKHFDINLPKDITKVCFADLNSPKITPGQEYEYLRNQAVIDENIFLIPPEKTEGFEKYTLQRINMTTILKDKNPYCVEVNKGLTIKKSFYDKLVTIE